MTAAWVRRGATAMAAARTAIGVVALAAPPLVGRPWVGKIAEQAPGRVLARGLGGRDLALGLGTLAALRQLPFAGTDHSDRVAGLWVGMGAMADSLDVLATAMAWDELPRIGRWLVAASAGGAAVAGAAAAWSLVTGEDDRTASAQATGEDDRSASAQATGEDDRTASAQATGDDRA